MNNRSKKCLTLLVAGMSIMLFFGATQAVAANIAASVYVQTGLTGIETGGWGHPSDSNSRSDTYGQASGSAGFINSSPAISATSIGASGVGYAKAIAGVDDYLTFSGVAGGYADVLIHIGGNWSLSYNPSVTNAPWVNFSLGWDQNSYSGRRSLASASIGGIGAWNENSDNDPYAASGTYYYDLPVRVYYGVNYHFGLAVIAEASTGENAYIDDPVIIDLPNGVTLTSLSNSKYAAPVPIPAAIWLFGTGLLGLFGVRRKIRK